MAIFAKNSISSNDSQIGKNDTTSIQIDIVKKNNVINLLQVVEDIEVFFSEDLFIATRETNAKSTGNELAPTEQSVQDM